MHLTNYSINKNSKDFVSNKVIKLDGEEEEEIGHKRSIKYVFRKLKGDGHDVQRVWY